MQRRRTFGISELPSVLKSEFKLFYNDTGYDKLFP